MMKAETNVERMTKILDDNYHTPLASKWIWRQARVAEAIDHYRLEIQRGLHGVRIVLTSGSFFERGLTDPQCDELDRLFNQFNGDDGLPEFWFESTMDAVEHFLKKVKEIKDGKSKSATQESL